MADEELATQDFPTWQDYSSKLPEGLPDKIYDAQRGAYFEQYVKPWAYKNNYNPEKIRQQFMETTPRPGRAEYPRLELGARSAARALIDPIAGLAGERDVQQFLKNKEQDAAVEAARQDINPAPYQMIGSMAGQLPYWYGGMKLAGLAAAATVPEAGALAGGVDLAAATAKLETTRKLFNTAAGMAVQGGYDAAKAEDGHRMVEGIEGAIEGGLFVGAIEGAGPLFNLLRGKHGLTEETAKAIEASAKGIADEGQTAKTGAAIEKDPTITQTVAQVAQEAVKEGKKRGRPRKTPVVDPTTEGVQVGVDLTESQLIAARRAAPVVVVNLNETTIKEGAATIADALKKGGSIDNLNGDPIAVNGLLREVDSHTQSAGLYNTKLQLRGEAAVETPTIILPSDIQAGMARVAEAAAVEESPLPLEISTTTPELPANPLIESLKKILLDPSLTTDQKRVTRLRLQRLSPQALKEIEAAGLPAEAKPAVGVEVSESPPSTSAAVHAKINQRDVLFHTTNMNGLEGIFEESKISDFGTSSELEGGVSTARDPGTYPAGGPFTFVLERKGLKSQSYVEGEAWRGETEELVKQSIPLSNVKELVVNKTALAEEYGNEAESILAQVVARAQNREIATKTVEDYLELSKYRLGLAQEVDFPLTFARMQELSRKKAQAAGEGQPTGARLGVEDVSEFDHLEQLANGKVRDKLSGRIYRNADQALTAKGLKAPDRFSASQGYPISRIFSSQDEAEAFAEMLSEANKQEKFIGKYDVTPKAKDIAVMPKGKQWEVTWTLTNSEGLKAPDRFATDQPPEFSDLPPIVNPKLESAILEVRDFPTGGVVNASTRKAAVTLILNTKLSEWVELLRFSDILDRVELMEERSPLGAALRALSDIGNLPNGDMLLREISTAHDRPIRALLAVNERGKINPKEKLRQLLGVKFAAREGEAAVGATGIAERPLQTRVIGQAAEAALPPGTAAGTYAPKGEKPTIYYRNPNSTNMFHEGIHSHIGNLGLTGYIDNLVRNHPTGSVMEAAFDSRLKGLYGNNWPEEAYVYAASAIRTNNERVLQPFIDADTDRPTVLRWIADNTDEMLRGIASRPDSLHGRTATRRLREVLRRSTGELDAIARDTTSVVGDKLEMEGGRYTVTDRLGVTRSFDSRDGLVRHLEEKYEEPLSTPQLVDESLVGEGVERPQMEHDSHSLGRSPIYTDPPIPVHGPPEMFAAGRIRPGQGYVNDFWISPKAEVHDLAEELSGADKKIVRDFGPHDFWANEQGSSKGEMLRKGWIRASDTGIELSEASLNSKKNLEAAVIAVTKKLKPDQATYVDIVDPKTTEIKTSVELTQEELLDFVDHPQKYLNRPDRFATLEPGSEEGPEGGQIKGGIQALSNYTRPFYAWLSTVAEKNKWPELYEKFKALDLAMVERDNFTRPFHKIANEVFKGVSGKRAADFTRYLEAAVEDKSKVAEELHISDIEIGKLNRLRNEIYDPLFTHYGVNANTYIENYAPHMRRNNFDPDSLRPSGKTTPEEVDFFAKHVRTGELDPRDMDLRRVTNAYIELGARQKFLGDPLKEAAELVNLKTPEGSFVTGTLQPILKRHLEAIRGIPDYTGKVMDGAVNASIQGINVMLESYNSKVPKMLQIEPIEANSRDVMGKFILLQYAGGLGLRPVVVIKDLLKVFITTYPILGGEYLAKGIRGAMKPGAWEVAEKAGALVNEQYLRSLMTESAGMSKGLGKVAEAVLKPMAWLDNPGRLVTFWGHVERAADAIRDFKGHGDVEKLVRSSAMTFLDSPLQKSFVKEITDALANSSTDLEGISHRIAKELTEVSHWNYRPGANPGIYKYTMGRLFGQYGTWPLNYIEYARRIALNPDKVEVAKAMTRLAVAHGAILAAGQKSGIDTAQWVFAQPMAYNGGPMYNAIVNIPNTVDFETYQGAQARREVVRPIVPGLIPGGGAMERLHRAIVNDDPELYKIMLGFVPLKSGEESRGLHQIIP